MQQKRATRIVWLALRGSILFLVLVWFIHTRLASPSTQPPKADPQTFIGHLAHKVGITEGQARHVLQELGPAMAVEFKRGHQVQLPHLGKFRLATTGDYKWDSRAREMRFVPDAYVVEYEPSPQILQEMNTRSPQDAKQEH